MPHIAVAEVWFGDVDAAGSSLDAVEARHHLLPPDEQIRAAAIADPGERLRWTRGRIALRSMLVAKIGAAEARAAFDVSKTGKPGLRSTRIAFSLSHSGPLVLIGVAPRGEPIGVDVETRLHASIDDTRRRSIEAAALELSPAQPLPPPSDPRRFLQAWARMEAVAKASELGIGGLLERVRDRGPGAEPGRPLAGLKPLLDEHNLRVEDLALDWNAVGAIALLRDRAYALRSFSEALCALAPMAQQPTAAVDRPDQSGQKDGSRSVAQPG